MKKGFTLVELLAVIAIVAVLGIVTIPMVMTTVEEGKKATFTSGAQSLIDVAKTYITRVEETGDFPKEGLTVEELKQEVNNYNYVSGVILKSDDGSIVVEGLSDGVYCASGTKNDLKVIKGNCSNLDTTPPTVKIILNKKTASSITILVNANDITSGIYGYSYSIDGVNYSEIIKKNVYTVEGLNKNTTAKIYVRVYNNIYDGSNSEENLKMSMTEQSAEFTTLEIEKPKFVVSTSENSATTVKLVDIIYPRNDGSYIYSYELNGKEEIVSGEQVSLTIINNGIIKAKIKTETEIIENELRIAGLDNEGPVANIVYNKTWETSKKIKVEVTYEQTGLSQEPYSYDGGKTWTSSNEKVYVTSENVSGKIQVRDVLGNITTKLKVNGEEKDDIEIGYIDNEKPECTLQLKGTLGQNNWYISNVEVSFKSMLDRAKYCVNGKCEEKEPGSGIKTSSIDINPVTNDGTTKVIGTVVDNAGNTNTCDIIVNKDANAPGVPTITASDNIGSGSWHGNNFTLKFSGSSSPSGVQYEYSTNGNNYTKGNDISINTNTTGTTYYVRACNNAGICGKASSYQVKLDKNIPNTPSIVSNDGIGSGSWHSSNFNLTIGGNGTISGTVYQYSTDGANYVNGSTIGISQETAGTTYYVRICNAIRCSKVNNYVVKIDKKVPSITTITGTVSLKFQENKDIKTLFNIGSYGISGGSTTCYLIQNNKRGKAISNNNQLALGINLIECEMVTTAGNKKSSRVTIKHKYDGTSYCSAGTYKNGACYFESNASVCGTEQKQVQTKTWSNCATTVNTCQYGCDSVWNANKNCTDQTDYNNCTQLQCKLWKKCDIYTQVSSCSGCKRCEAAGMQKYYCIEYKQDSSCGWEYITSNSRCANAQSKECISYGTKKVCSGGYDQKNCSSCKTGSPNECRGGYVTTTKIETVPASCNKSEYIKYLCSSKGTNTNTNQSINATLSGKICQF